MREGANFQLDCKNINIAKENNEIVIRLKASLYHFLPNFTQTQIRVTNPQVLPNIESQYSIFFKSNVRSPEQQPSNSQNQHAQPELSNSMIPEQGANKPPAQIQTNAQRSNNSTNIFNTSSSSNKMGIQQVNQAPSRDSANNYAQKNTSNISNSSANNQRGNIFAGSFTNNSNNLANSSNNNQRQPNQSGYHNIINPQQDSNSNSYQRGGIFDDPKPSLFAQKSNNDRHSSSISNKSHRYKHDKITRIT